jgi:hypothetical protein
MSVQLLQPELPGGVAAGPGINAGGSVPNCTLTMTHGRRVFLATFTIPFASVPLNPFRGHGPAAGDFVISLFTDPVTHCYLIGPNGLTDTIF